MPALFIRTSVPPKRARTAASSASTAARSLTSVSDVITAAAPSGAAAASAASASASRAAPRSAMHTRKPRSANRIAAANPIPDAPPVTTETADRHQRRMVHVVSSPQVGGLLMLNQPPGPRQPHVGRAAQHAPSARRQVAAPRRGKRAPPPRFRTGSAPGLRNPPSPSGGASRSPRPPPRRSGFRPDPGNTIRHSAATQRRKADGPPVQSSRSTAQNSASVMPPSTSAPRRAHCGRCDPGHHRPRLPAAHRAIGEKRMPATETDRRAGGRRRPRRPHGRRSAGRGRVRASSSPRPCPPSAASC